MSMTITCDHRAIDGADGAQLHYDDTLPGSGTPVIALAASEAMGLDPATRSCVYYVALRVTAQRDGVDTPYAKVQNLDRVRVVVHPADH